MKKYKLLIMFFIISSYLYGQEKQITVYRPDVSKHDIGPMRTYKITTNKQGIINSFSSSDETRFPIEIIVKDDIVIIKYDYQDYETKTIKTTIYEIKRSKNKLYTNYGYAKNITINSAPNIIYEHNELKLELIS